MHVTPLTVKKSLSINTEVTVKTLIAGLLQIVIIVKFKFIA